MKRKRNSNKVDGEAIVLILITFIAGWIFLINLSLNVMVANHNYRDYRRSVIELEQSKNYHGIDLSQVELDLKKESEYFQKEYNSNKYFKAQADHSEIWGNITFFGCAILFISELAIATVGITNTIHRLNRKRRRR